MKPWVSAAAICGIWAVIYLPGLGVPEYKGEEPRRVQPALVMLDTGDWLVPHIGGEIYLNKPPVINWAVAAAFVVGGARNEWTARMPSVLSVLVLALGLGVLMREVIGPGGAFAAATLFLTHIALMEKGRLIEIEALYIALFGMALLWWVRVFVRGGGNAALWIGPWILLALGVLTKGPPHLGFFYVLTGAVLWRAKERLRVGSPWHAMAVMLGLGVIAAWVVPYFSAISGGRALETWYNQIAVRVAGEGDQMASWDWLWNVPKNLANFLPWTVLLPLLWWPGFDAGLSAREQALFRGLRDGAAVMVIGLGVLPGVAPRYLMPLLVVPCLLLGWGLARNVPPVWPRLYAIWHGFAVGVLILAAGVAVVAPFFGFVPEPVSYGFGMALAIGSLAAAWRWRANGRTLAGCCGLSGAAMGVLTLGYVALALPQVVRNDNVRPVARGIDVRVPPDAALVVMDPDSRPFLAYARRGLQFARKPEDVPSGEVYVIEKAGRRERFDDPRRVGGRRAEEVWRFWDREKEEFVLMRLTP